MTAGAASAPSARRIRLSALGAVTVGPVLLTALRLVQPDWTWAVQAVAFTPLALPVYAVLLAAWAVPARGGSRPARVGVLVCLLGLAAHLAWWVPRAVDDAPAPRADAEPVVVMGANLLAGGADPAAVVAAVRADDVDVLVTTEVTDAEVRRLEAAGLSALLPHHAGGTDPADAVAGTIVWAREPVRVLARLDTGLRSYLVRVGDLTLVAAHPSAPLDAADWTHDQGVLRDAVATHRPDLLVGDLNATLDHAPLRAVLGEGYRDAAEEAGSGTLGWQPTWPSGGQVRVLGIAVPGVVAIDHVLLGEGWTTTGTHTVVLPGTDHRALVAVVARA